MKKSLLPAAVVFMTFVLATGLKAQDKHQDKHDDYRRFEFRPGTLVLSRSIYTAPSTLLVPGETLLPPNCVANTTYGITCAFAKTDATFPTVWDNDDVDGSFGITSPIFLDNITLDGHVIDTLPIDPKVLVTSFSSKSELAVNRSLDRKSITFMGYVAPNNTLDVSNSNTPGLIDPSNPVPAAYYRAVAEVEADGRMRVTETNAYSGDNSRAAIKAGWRYYAVGNSNNGSINPPAITGATGAELIPPFQAPLLVPDQIGTLSLIATDKAGKETNFRGLAIFGNTLYVTKGSGSNGVNTVYQVGTAGTLPTVSNAPGGIIADTPITVLPGFPNASTPARKNPAARFPFGIWFADANTLYVADEGDDCTSNSASCPNVEKKATAACSIACSVYNNAANQTAAGLPGAGLQKWVYNSGTGMWDYAYTLQAGLDLGGTYVVPGYPTGTNSDTGLPWAPATDGLRNITGQVNKDGTVTIWAITSTVSGSDDQGADPNRLVKITDSLSATTLPVAEQFVTLRTACSGEVFRGIAFAPQDRDDDWDYARDDYGRDNHDHDDYSRDDHDHDDHGR